MDYYCWVDPFAEIERANQNAARAREDGRNDVLDYEYRNPGLIQRTIEDQAYSLAKHVVEQQIRPTFADAMSRKKVRDLTLDFLSFTPLRHVVSLAEGKAVSRPMWDQSEPLAVMTELVVPSFRYAIVDRLA